MFLIVPSDLSNQKFFGYSVGVHGDYLIVGARWDAHFGAYSGAGYVYKKGADGIWGDEQKLLAFDGYTYDQLGHSASIYGDYLVLGAFIDNDSRGSAYLYKRSVDDAWELDRKLEPASLHQSSRFGDALDLYEDVLVVGASGQNNYGGAFVYERDSLGEWGTAVELEFSNGTTPLTQSTGIAVHVHNDLMIIGAPFEQGNEVGTGLAFIFERDANESWVQKEILLAPNGDQGDTFGASIAADSDRILIGAPTDDNELDLNTGSAYLFENNEDGEWVYSQSFEEPYSTHGSYFGNAVCLVDSEVTISAYAYNQLTEGVVYYSTLNTSTSTIDLQSSGDKLYQNSPNPFSGETVISFELNRASLAKISITDSSGRIVWLSENEFNEGYNEVLVDGLNTPGLYFYTLESDKLIRTKKMIVVE